MREAPARAGLLKTRPHRLVTAGVPPCRQEAIGSIPSQAQRTAVDLDRTRFAAEAAAILPRVLWVAEPFTREAERLLRAPGHFQWSTVTLLALVVYVYSVEVERRNWSAILAGVAFWLMDWFNELLNALVLHFNGQAALWTVTGSSSFVILIGLTIEISLFFAINGVVYVKLLPPDRRTRIIGIPNRWAIALALSLVSVGVELLLHELGVFHWHYWWWNAASFPVIVVFGYLTFYIVASVVYDAPSRSRQLAIVSGLALLDLVGGLLFGPALGWI